jgi:hypothetical protein
MKNFGPHGIGCGVDSMAVEGRLVKDFEQAK